MSRRVHRPLQGELPFGENQRANMGRSRVSRILRAAEKRMESKSILDIPDNLTPHEQDLVGKVRDDLRKSEGLLIDEMPFEVALQFKKEIQMAFEDRGYVADFDEGSKRITVSIAPRERDEYWK